MRHLFYRPIRSREPLIKSARAVSGAFSANRGTGNGGILYVFPASETARIEEKTRRSAEDDLFRASQGFFETWSKLLMQSKACKFRANGLLYGKKEGTL